MLLRKARPQARIERGWQAEVPAEPNSLNVLPKSIDAKAVAEVIAFASDARAGADHRDAVVRRSWLCFCDALGGSPISEEDQST